MIILPFSTPQSNTDTHLIHNRTRDEHIPHTTNHPILTTATPGEVIEEIGRSREQLEAVIGGKVDSFAYPNGRPTTDFSPDHVALVKSAGYRYAVTTRGGVLRQETDPYLIPRFAPWGPGKSKMLVQILRNQVLQ